MEGHSLSLFPLFSAFSALYCFHTRRRESIFGSEMRNSVTSPPVFSTMRDVGCPPKSGGENPFSVFPSPRPSPNRYERPASGAPSLAVLGAAREDLEA